MPDPEADPTSDADGDTNPGTDACIDSHEPHEEEKKPPDDENDSESIKEEKEGDADTVQKSEVEDETKAETTEGEGGPKESGENQIDPTEQGERDDIGPLTFYQNDQKFGNTMEALKAQREEGKFCDTILLAGTNEFKVCSKNSRQDC